MFTCVLDDSNLDQLSSALREKLRYTEANPAATFVTGQAVAAKYSRDNEFYRGSIIKENEDHTCPKRGYGIKNLDAEKKLSRLPKKKNRFFYFLFVI